MRFGHWRGVTLAIALLGVLGIGSSNPARAGGIFGFGHTIPRETLAQDYRTGGVYYAPPIPYGEYTKDYVGCMHAAAGLLHGGIGKLCGACFGKGCGLCGGLGCLHGDACGGCGGKGCGLCGGKGLFGKHHGGGGGLCGSCGGQGCGACGGGMGVGSGLGEGVVIGQGLGGHGLGLGLGHGHGACGPLGCGAPGCGTVAAAPQGLVAPGKMIASPQAGVAMPACGGCGGKGCGLCGGLGGLLGKHHGGGMGDPCGSCGGRGCGLCGGLGRLLGKHHGGGGGMGGGPCGACGGRGCGLCGGKGLGLGGLLHGKGGLLLGAGHGLANKLGFGGVEYFVGPGGPVPLTPGYVPYINPVRSPRDFFAFPPFVDRAF